MEKIGQAAMEFLMTYGWAILAVIISIAALAYFGVLSPNVFFPDVVTLTPGLAAVDVKIIENAVIVNIQNGMGQNLNDFHLSIPSCRVNGVTTSGHHNFQNGELKQFIIPCGKDFSGKINEDLEIIFTSESLTHTRVGSISGIPEKGKLTAYYSFGNDQAINLLNGVPAILKGGFVQCDQPGILGDGCLYTVYSSSSKANIRIQNPFTNNEEFTISMWIKPEDITVSYGLIGSDPLSGACLQPSMISSVGGIGSLWSEINTPGCGSIPTITNNVFSASDIWYHLTWIFDGDQLYYYIGGSLLRVENIPSNNFYHLPSVDYFIGRAGGFGFKGTIDEVAIFDTAL